MLISYDIFMHILLKITVMCFADIHNPMTCAFFLFFKNSIVFAPNKYDIG